MVASTCDTNGNVSICCFPVAGGQVLRPKAVKTPPEKGYPANGVSGYQHGMAWVCVGGWNSASQQIEGNAS